MRPARLSATRWPMSWTISTRSLTRSKSPGIERSIARGLLEVAPDRGDEDGRIRVERIAVGHPRDVVGHRALDAVAVGDPLVLGRQEVGALREVPEQLPQHALRLAVLGLRRP